MTQLNLHHKHYRCTGDKQEQNKGGNEFESGFFLRFHDLG
jgi:hypothetical protein